MGPVGVMHITDSLDSGGAEKMAVSLVNLLPRSRYRAYLCTTREEGPLTDLVAEDVGRLRLERRRRFDITALRRLISFILLHNIKILHAHNASVFIAKVAALFPPYPAVIWHNHTGAFVDDPVWLYRRVVSRISGVITVNQPLAEWSRSRLAVAADRIWFIPNFVSIDDFHEEPPRLPGTRGARIVSVANLHPPKDHLSLVRAMARVISQVPEAHLFLVGAFADPDYCDLIQKEIVLQGLKQNVSLLGFRRDVSAIIRECDIGVLSSFSEGFPLVLLEYGMAGLPTVATEVGECANVLDEGRAGLVVPPGSPDRLARALLSLLKSPERRSALGSVFRRHVQEKYNPDSIIQQVSRVYEIVLHP